MNQQLSQSRICARCGHVERACDCKEPVWVSWARGFGKSVYDLRKLSDKKITGVWPLPPQAVKGVVK